MGPLRNSSGITALVGLVGAIVFFLISLAISPEDWLRDLYESLAILTITGILALLLQGEELRDAVYLRLSRIAEPAYWGDLARAGRKVVKRAQNRSLAPEQRDLISEHKERILEEALERMEWLGNKGKFETPYWSCDLLLRLVDRMEGTDMIGLSPWPDDQDWWNQESGLGRRFLEANRAAINNRHCSITRIFLCYSGVSDSRPDSALRAEMYRHSEAGVEVHYTDASKVGKIDKEAHAVIGEAIAFQGHTGNIDQCDKNYFWVSKRKCQRLKTRLDSVRDAGKPYKKSEEDKPEEVEYEST